MAREVASRGITVNAVAPGIVKTRMTEVLNDSQWGKILDRIPMTTMPRLLVPHL